MAQIRQMASNEPELQDELMAQQRLIHEQQRLADEARLELEMEKEPWRWRRTHFFHRGAWGLGPFLFFLIFWRWTSLAEPPMPMPCKIMQ